MNKSIAIETATIFLASRRIAFSEPVTVEPTNDGAFFVTFTNPESLKPDVVVDPPDIPVIVHASGKVDLVIQM